MEFGAHVRGLVCGIGLKRDVVEADYEKAAVPVTEREGGLDDLRRGRGGGRIKPSLDLDIQAFARPGDKGPERIIVWNHAGKLSRRCASDSQAQPICLGFALPLAKRNATMVLLHDHFAHTGAADPVAEVDGVFVSVVIIEELETVA